MSALGFSHAPPRVWASAPTVSSAAPSRRGGMGSRPGGAAAASRGRDGRHTAGPTLPRLSPQKGRRQPQLCVSTPRVCFALFSRNGLFLLKPRFTRRALTARPTAWHTGSRRLRQERHRQGPRSPPHPPPALSPSAGSAGSPPAARAHPLCPPPPRCPGPGLNSLGLRDSETRKERHQNIAKFFSDFKDIFRTYTHI